MTLSEQWAAAYDAELLAKLEWELDAGWRLVTPVAVVDDPQPDPQVVSIGQRSSYGRAIKRQRRSYRTGRPVQGLRIA